MADPWVPCYADLQILHWLDLTQPSKQAAKGRGLEACMHQFVDIDHHLCRYLYRHNYTISVPEVYYQVNRPDLNALYVDQLIQRDFSRQGSTDLWVKYLTTGELRGLLV